MLEENCISLAKYRMETSMETLNVARECLENKHFKDSINRAYYASFYAARAVLALERVDFKRHKDVIAYFNKNYVATGIFDREIGRNLARLKQKREQSDYDDFFISSKEEAQKQFDNAESIVAAIIEYMRKNNSGTIILVSGSTVVFVCITSSTIRIPYLSRSTLPSMTSMPSALRRLACSPAPPKANAPDSSPFAFTTL